MPGLPRSIVGGKRMRRGNVRFNRGISSALENLESRVLLSASGITIVKTPDKTNVNPGDSVTYTYTVTNSGTSPETSVVVTDDNGTPGDTSDDFNPIPTLAGDGFNIGDTTDKGVLDPGETWLYTSTRVLPGHTVSSSILSNFDGTPIAAGNIIWFNAVLKPGTVNANTVLNFTGANIVIGTGSSAVIIPMPDAIVQFSGASTAAATTIFDPVANEWVTTVPASGISGNVFLAALPYVVTPSVASLLANGGGKSVQWNFQVGGNQSGSQANWQWAANVYAGSGTNAFTAVAPSAYNAIGVKPLDTQTAQYGNSDHAGTPENFKSGLLGGARGGGGSNYTGSYSGTGRFVTPMGYFFTNTAVVTASAQDQTVTDTTTATVTVGTVGTAGLSGYVYLDDDGDGIKDPGEGGIGGVQIILTGTDAQGNAVNLTVLTNANGYYDFAGLAAGTYSIQETQPLAFNDGIDTIGSAGGSVTNDEFFNIHLKAGIQGINYNFGEESMFGGC